MKEILETYKLPELKKMIRATNLTGYSKLNKFNLIKLMTRPENIDRFKSIKPKSARLPPVAEGTKIPKKKVLNELKKLYPAYKEYIEFYQNTGFEKPKDLPPPPKWLLEGKEPPPKFKIPKIIITEIENPNLKKKKIRKIKKEIAAPDPSSSLEKKAVEIEKPNLKKRKGTIRILNRKLIMKK